MVEAVRRLSIKVVSVVVMLVLLTTSCGRDRQPQGASFSVRILTARTVSERWERAVERALDEIAAEFGGDVARVRLDETANERDRLAEQGRAGISLVFCVGGCSETTLHSVATEFPNTVFVLLPGQVHAGNVAGIRFLPEEVGYLAGAVAGALNPDGQLGLLRGDGQPWLEPLEEGYVTGFKSRWRRAEVKVGEGPEGAWELGSTGVLISLYAADRADPEVLAAAHNAGLRLVVTDPDLIDAASDTVVAAIDFNVTEAMLRVTREVRDHTFVGRVFAFDLGSGVLDVVISPALAPDSRMLAEEALEEARAEITAGLVEFDGLGL
jgi:basic membrane lipoprotein Med (substrate-binding protein (PBP1-ABC) superfamily)